MKKLFLYTFLALMFCNVGFSNEFKSKLGFYLKIPVTWKVIDKQNAAELIDEAESDYDWDKETTKEILKLADNTNILYVFPINN